MEHEKLKLGNLANGAAEAMFQREVDKTMENIQDVNTPAQTTRVITLKIKIKPSETRQIGAVSVYVDSTLPGIKAQHAALYFGKENNKFVALQQKDLQGEIDFNVVPMEEKNDQGSN